VYFFLLNYKKELSFPHNNFHLHLAAISIPRIYLFTPLNKPFDFKHGYKTSPLSCPAKSSLIKLVVKKTD